jgi:hypothetical protein
MLSIMRGTEVNPKQIERVCHHYGGVLEEEILSGIKEGKSKEYNPLFLLIEKYPVVIIEKYPV